MSLNITLRKGNKKLTRNKISEGIEFPGNIHNWSEIFGPKSKSFFHYSIECLFRNETNLNIDSKNIYSRSELHNVAHEICRSI